MSAISRVQKELQFTVRVYASHSPALVTICTTAVTQTSCTVCALSSFRCCNKLGGCHEYTSCAAFSYSMTAFASLILLPPTLYWRYLWCHLPLISKIILHESRLFIRRLRLYLSADDGCIYLPMTAVFICRLRLYLSADYGCIYPPITAVFIRRWRLYLSADDGCIYAPMTAVFIRRWRLYLSTDEGCIYPPMTAVFIYRWRLYLSADVGCI